VARDKGQGASGGSAEGADRPQDPIVERDRANPGEPPPDPKLRMCGFLGDSERSGFRRLYFTRDLDYYAEFRIEAVLHMAPKPADVPPFFGDEATRVTLRRDTAIEYTRTLSARPLDQFDLDFRLGGPSNGYLGELPICTADGFIATCVPITTPRTSCAFCTGGYP
jgi:hypothetical protein